MMTEYTCERCGTVFDTTCDPEDVQCPECEAIRCPHCEKWFGEI